MSLASESRLPSLDDLVTPSSFWYFPDKGRDRVGPSGPVVATGEALAPRSMLPLLTRLGRLPDATLAVVRSSRLEAIMWWQIENSSCNETVRPDS